MDVARRWSLAWLLLILAVALGAPATAQPTATDLECARTWLGRESELEEYLRTAPILRTEDIPLGVTSPRRAFLPPDGPILSFAWKPIRPGVYRGRRESYRSEIAAYLLDRLLALGMVPPTVERRHEGSVGAAIMWVAPTRMWREIEADDLPSGPAWAFEIFRQRMFDNLIANDDRNQGNLLIDPDGHLTLIDHSRAFGTGRGLVYQMQRFDADLWAAMAGLTEETTSAALRPWLDRGQVRAILRRRDRMAQDIDRLVRERGEASVLLRLVS
jgi:hypothetical protein